jgi:serine/threonine protein kinase
MKDDIEKAFNNNLEIIKQLDSGSQKYVYIINSNTYGRSILKLIDNIHGENLERVKREIQIITTNNIKYVPKIFESEIIIVNGRNYLYIIEELINGESLKSLLLRDKKISLENAYYLLERLLIV